MAQAQINGHSRVKPVVRAARGDSKSQRSAKKETPKEQTATGFEQVFTRFQQAQQDLMGFFKVPTWKRTLAALVTALVVSSGIAWVANELITWLMAGALMHTGSVFIAGVIFVLGLALTMYYGGKLAARIGGAVLTGEADERAIAAYDAVRSKVKGVFAWFTPKVEPITVAG